MLTSFISLKLLKSNNFQSYQRYFLSSFSSSPTSSSTCPSHLTSSTLNYTPPPELNSYETNLIKNYALNILDQHIDVISMLKSDEDYHKKNEIIFNSSIGSHIRHSLNHFQNLLYPLESLSNNNQGKKEIEQDIKEGDEILIDYDTRSRNSLIELDRKEALKEIYRLKEIVNSVDMMKNIKIKFSTYLPAEKTKILENNENNEENENKEEKKEINYYQLNSYVGRELSFVTHHAIHHLSSVKLILSNIDYIDQKAIEDIGIAPSTQIHRVLKSSK